MRSVALDYGVSGHGWGHGNDHTTRKNPPIGFDPKYTQAQRRAIARLMLDNKRSGPEIVGMAAAGEIYGFGPFTVPKGTVYYLADLERQRRQREIDAEQSKTPGGRLAVTHRKSVEMLERERRRLERDAAKNGGRVDPVKLQKLTSALANLVRAQPRNPTIPHQESNGTPASEPKPEPSDFQRRLEAAHQEALVREEAARVEKEAREAEEREAARQEAEIPAPPTTKSSLIELRHDQTPEGRRAYENRMRELGWKEQTIEIMLDRQRRQG